MDPLSITADCVALAATAAKLGDTITRFARDVRAARANLDAISRELGSLKLILSTLENEFQDKVPCTADDIPEALKSRSRISSGTVRLHFGISLVYLRNKPAVRSASLRNGC
jgi:hypothetical protein